jgi:hypothetical protein
VERQNLSMRMSIRRFTRLTNAFSKKVENHAAAVALWFMYYNFCRVHQTLPVTPAMEAGISNHAWTIEELMGRFGRGVDWSSMKPKTGEQAALVLLIAYCLDLAWKLAH